MALGGRGCGPSRARSSRSSPSESTAPDDAMTRLDATSKLAERIRAIECDLVVPALLRSDGPRPTTLAQRMDFYKVPGISVAVIHDYQVEWARTYGVLEVAGADAVTPDTLFQGGSIGKPVVALAALSMVDNGL